MTDYYLDSEYNDALTKAIGFTVTQNKGVVTFKWKNVMSVTLASETATFSTTGYTLTAGVIDPDAAKIDAGASALLGGVTVPKKIVWGHTFDPETTQFVTVLPIGEYTFTLNTQGSDPDNKGVNSISTASIKITEVGGNSSADVYKMFVLEDDPSYYYVLDNPTSTTTAILTNEATGPSQGPALGSAASFQSAPAIFGDAANTAWDSFGTGDNYVNLDLSTKSFYYDNTKGFTLEFICKTGDTFTNVLRYVDGETGVESQNVRSGIFIGPRGLGIGLTVTNLGDTKFIVLPFVLPNWSVGEVYHVVCIAKGEQIKIYVNGAYVATYDRTTVYQYDQAFTAAGLRTNLAPGNVNPLPKLSFGGKIYPNVLRSSRLVVSNSLAGDWDPVFTDGTQDNILSHWSLYDHPLSDEAILKHYKAFIGQLNADTTDDGDGTTTITNTAPPEIKTEKLPSGKVGKAYRYQMTLASYRDNFNDIDSPSGTTGAGVGLTGSTTTGAGVGSTGSTLNDINSPSGTAGAGVGAGTTSKNAINADGTTNTAVKDLHFVWAADELPPGLSMSESGLITGTPTVKGTTYVTVTVGNIYGNDKRHYFFEIVGVNDPDPDPDDDKNPTKNDKGDDGPDDETGPGPGPVPPGNKGYAPVWTGASLKSIIPSIQVKGALSFRFTTDASPDATYKSSNLQSWMTLNKTTGHLTGTAPATSNTNDVDGTKDPYEITVTAVNSVGRITKTFKLDVTKTYKPNPNNLNGISDPGEQVLFTKNGNTVYLVHNGLIAWLTVLSDRDLANIYPLGGVYLGFYDDEGNQVATPPGGGTVYLNPYDLSNTNLYWNSLIRVQAGVEWPFSYGYMNDSRTLLINSAGEVTIQSMPAYEDVQAAVYTWLGGRTPVSYYKLRADLANLVYNAGYGETIYSIDPTVYTDLTARIQAIQNAYASNNTVASDSFVSNIPGSNDNRVITAERNNYFDITSADGSTGLTQTSSIVKPYTDTQKTSDILYSYYQTLIKIYAFINKHYNALGYAWNDANIYTPLIVSQGAAEVTLNLVGRNLTITVRIPNYYYTVTKVIVVPIVITDNTMESDAAARAAYVSSIYAADIYTPDGYFNNLTSGGSNDNIVRTSENATTITVTVTEPSSNRVIVQTITKPYNNTQKQNDANSSYAQTLAAVNNYMANTALNDYNINVIAALAVKIGRAQVTVINNAISANNGTIDISVIIPENAQYNLFNSIAYSKSYYDPSISFNGKYQLPNTDVIAIHDQTQNGFVVDYFNSYGNNLVSRAYVNRPINTKGDYNLNGVYSATNYATFTITQHDNYIDVKFTDSGNGQYTKYNIQPHDLIYTFNGTYPVNYTQFVNPNGNANGHNIVIHDQNDQGLVLDYKTSDTNVYQTLTVTRQIYTSGDYNLNGNYITPGGTFTFSQNPDGTVDVVLNAGGDLYGVRNVIHPVGR